MAFHNSVIDIVKSNQNLFSDTTYGNFIDFWKIFRIGIIESDTAQIISHCIFLLNCRGPLDDDPIIKVSRSQFVKVFSLFLNQWNGQDLEGSTELDYIKKVENPNEKSVKGQIRIGDMVFYLKERNWKLGLLYLNDETLESLNKLHIALVK